MTQMNFFETMLTLAERLSRKLTPLDAFLQQVVNRVLPHATVQACSGYACESQCEPAPFDTFCWSLNEYGYWLYYSSSFVACEYGQLDGCKVYTGNCCHF